MLSNPNWEKKQLLDLSKPSLKTLSYILRHSELWPKGFEWNFRDCSNCAMGLAVALWDSTNTDRLTISNSGHTMEALINTNRNFLSEVFLGSGDWVPRRVTGCKNFAAVTPEMVADQINKHLQSKE